MMGTKVMLSLACGNCEIVRALKERTVQTDGVELVLHAGHGPHERHAFSHLRDEERKALGADEGHY